MGVRDFVVSLERCMKKRHLSEADVDAFCEEIGIVTWRLPERRDCTNDAGFSGLYREIRRGERGAVPGTNSFDDWNGPLAGRRLRERLEAVFEGFLRKDITRTAGIEPTQTVLKTVVLPLNYAPKC